jgi:hypothetical protein
VARGKNKRRRPSDDDLRLALRFVAKINSPNGGVLGPVPEELSPPEKCIAWDALTLLLVMEFNRRRLLAPKVRRGRKVVWTEERDAELFRDYRRLVRDNHEDEVLLWKSRETVVDRLRALHPVKYKNLTVEVFRKRVNTRLRLLRKAERDVIHDP